MKRIPAFFMMLLLVGSIVAQTTVTIGTGTSTSKYPLGASRGFERSASIYTSGEIAVAGDITSVAWYPTVARTITVPMKIYLKETSLTSFTADTWANLIDGATLVYDADNTTIAANQWNSFSFFTNFDFGGTNNLLVLVEANYGGAGAGTGSETDVQYTTASLKHQRWARNNSPPGGAGTLTNNRPNIQLDILVPFINAMSGDYTVGVTTFNRLSGRNITFKKVINKVNKQVFVESRNKERPNKECVSSYKANGEYKTVESEEVSYLPYDNGKPYTGPLHLIAGEHPEIVFPDGIKGVYATITAAVAALNTAGVEGPTNFLLEDATYPSETFPITINVTNGSHLPTASNRVTIKPDTDIVTTISGSSDDQIFRIVSSYITIDGAHNGGTIKNMTIENTSENSPDVVVINWSGNTTPTVGVELKNCFINNGSQTSSAVVVSGFDGDPGYFNDITIKNISIQNAYIGIYCKAEPGGNNGSGLLISGNNLNEDQSIRNVGIYLQGVDRATVSRNVIGNFDGSFEENDMGIWLALNTTNIIVESNKIGPLEYTGTAGYGCHGITISSGVANCGHTIMNNMIFNISGDGDDHINYFEYNPFGIVAYTTLTQSGINVFNNSINLFGNTLNFSGSMSAGVALDANSTAEFKNNIIVNKLGLSASTGYGSVGIYLESAPTQIEESNYNDIWVSPTGSGIAAVGRISTSNYTTLSAWKTATSGDANSLSGDPKFVSDTELHIQTGVYSPVIETGLFLEGIVTDDIDMDTRLTPPDMGADAVSLFNQPFYDGGSAFTSTLDDGDPINYEVADNFSNVNDPIVHLSFYGFSNAFVNDKWVQQTPAPEEPFIVRFYEYEVLEAGSYQISLEDSYGDGWTTDGTPAYHYVTVSVNGTPVLTDMTLTAGFGPENRSFSVSAGDIVTTVFTNNGDYSEQCKYTIYDPSAEILAIDNEFSDETPTGLYLAARQPDWDNPVSEQEINAQVSTYGSVWDQSKSLYRFDIYLDEYVDMEEGWVSAQIDANSGSGVWFLWLNSATGDEQSFQKNRIARGNDVKGKTNPAVENFGNTRNNVAYDLAFDLHTGIIVQLDLFLEGLFNEANGNMDKAKEYDSDSDMIVDKYGADTADIIQVELHDAADYSSIAFQVDDVALTQSGTANFLIPTKYNGTYYLTIKNRNHLETVTATAFQFNTYDIEYELYDLAEKAYGENMKEVDSGELVIFAGDVNQDGYIDINDAGPVNTGILQGLQGYLVIDVNGDGYIDINDAGLLNTNILGGVEKITP